MLILIIFCLTLTGCASWQTPAEFDDSVLRSRAVTGEDRGVKLNAAVLSSDESRRMFGADVNGTAVQPIWIEIENTTSQVLWLLRTGTDPDLFSPLEVAWTFHKSFSSETNAMLDEHFDAMSFQNPIAPGTTQSGIIFTNPHHKTRLLSIDILGQGQIFPFTLFPLVPDDAADENNTYAKLHQLIEEATVDFQHTDRFRNRLEKLPCCAASADRTEAGDPLNIILVGQFADIATALVRRGFRIKVLDFDQSHRLFDRSPDVVVRKTGQAGMPENWLRIWVAPFRYQGQEVFLVQAGRPLGWRYSVRSEEDMKLNPNVDEVRNLFIQDMLYSGGLGKLGYITGVGATGPGKPRSSLGGASYQTDGLRAVLFLETRPLSLSDVQILDWYPALKLREADAVKEIENDSK